MLYQNIKNCIEALDFSILTEARKKELRLLIWELRQVCQEKKGLGVNFICTHNSRRSHLSQIWAAAIAHHVGLDNFCFYSGGTEATALYPMVKQVLEDDGFVFEMLKEDELNPSYYVNFASYATPLVCFSKKYDHKVNPSEDFIAVMSCTDADQNCPIVHGADAKFRLSYEDPKASDGTDLQYEVYKSCSHLIATELLYIFEHVISYRT